MSKIFIIIQREFLTRIQKKSFIILTILMPFIIAAVVATPLLLASIKDDTQHTVMLVDKTLKYAPLFTDNESYHFVTAPEVLPEFRDEETGVKAVILIADDLMENPNALKMYSSEEVPADLQRLT
ncbi:MAG: ABC transporter permease, partial [Bacteroidaceae bacterium]|nr:ABC transporter permease [Bacteroidaceae bacterium]